MRTCAIRHRIAMRRWLGSFVALTLLVGANAPARAADADSAAPVARQLAEMQEQVRRLEERLKAEQQSMQRRMEELQQQLKAQSDLIERLQAPPPLAAAAAPSPPAAAAAPAPPVAAEKPRDLTAPIRLLGSSRAYLNLSFNALTDFGWSTTSDVTELQLGDHDPIQRGFTIANTEIVLDGAIDPYFTGFADVVFKLDENNETEVELEEAYLQTSSLPWNLQVRGGQFLTEFGRHNTQHPHRWDFVDVPLVLGRFLGPEGLRNPGIRLSWLTPTPFYSEALLTVMNSQGGTAASFRNDEGVRFGRTPVETRVRAVGDLIYVPRYAVSFDLTDSQTLVTGVSAAFGPNATGQSTDTQIYGFDFYWRWKPEWQAAGWPFVSFQAEALYRRFEAESAVLLAEDEAEPPLFLPRESLHDYGFYAQALYGFTRRWVAGLRGEYVTGDSGAFRPDSDRADRFRLAPNLTFYPTEFSKLRLQWNYDHGQLRGDDHSVWLQTEFLLGSHGAHKF